jgi:ABC-2 type transport system permease protein
MLQPDFYKRIRSQFDLTTALVRRELWVKYRGSVFGYLWSMLNPLIFMLVISLVFSFLVKGVPNYHLYVLSGILFWNLTNNSIQVGTQGIVNGAALIRKVQLPIWIFPIVPVLTFSINFLMALIPYFVIDFAWGVPMTLMVSQLPFVLILFMSFLAGICLTLASLNVFFRDVGHVIEPIMVMTMYATPVVYDRHQVGFPEMANKVLEMNPLTHFVEAGRNCLFWGRLIAPSEWILMFLLAIGSLAAGILVYNVARKKFIFAL